MLPFQKGMQVFQQCDNPKQKAGDYCFGIRYLIFTLGRVRKKKKKRWLFLSGYTCGRRREMRRRHDPTRWGGCHGLSVSNHLKGEGWEDESCSGVWCFRIRQHTCAWWRFKILSKHLTQHRWQKNWHSVPQYTHRYICIRKYSVVL